MLRDSTTTAAAVVIIVRRRPRELPLAMITWENQFKGFLYFPIWVWGSANIVIWLVFVVDITCTLIGLSRLSCSPVILMGQLWACKNKAKSHKINKVLTLKVWLYRKISNLSLAILFSLLFARYSKLLVWDFPIKTSLMVNKQLILSFLWVILRTLWKSVQGARVLLEVQKTCSGDIDNYFFSSIWAGRIPKSSNLIG